MPTHKYIYIYVVYNNQVSRSKTKNRIKAGRWDKRSFFLLVELYIYIFYGCIQCRLYNDTLKVPFFVHSNCNLIHMQCIEIEKQLKRSKQSCIEIKHKLHHTCYIEGEKSVQTPIIRRVAGKVWRQKNA